MPQQVCTTIWSLQSSAERTLFVAGTGRQRVGTMWRHVKLSLLVRLSVQCNGDGRVG